MMRDRVIAILLLIGAGMILAGCTGIPAQSPPAVTTPASIAAPVATTPVPQPSFSMGDHYLKQSYSFQSENDLVTEQFRVDNPSWGIEFDVTPLNDNINYCWFVMTVTNLDTGNSDTYGYGRENGYELQHLIPMYTTGPYKIEMKGNRVNVKVTAAKRNP